MKKNINENIKPKREKYYLNIRKKYAIVQFRYSLKIIIAILIFLCLFHSFRTRKEKQEDIHFEYFACFGGIARLENLYIRDLISYYLSIGFEKFIIGDNNFPNVEKLSDVIEDYVNNGFVDIIEIFGSSIGQVEFYGIIYEKYKNTCAWISFFDFDEYLRMISDDNQIIPVKKYLSNEKFKKCESISFNWLIYSDNNLLYYDNRSVLERFPIPLYTNKENRLVKSIIRGNLKKKVFYKSSSHVPNKRLHICNSLGKILKRYSQFYLKPPVLKNAYLMHFTTKTAEEFINKIKRGFLNVPYNITDRIKYFFEINDFSEEKLKMFEKAFNRTFEQFAYYQKNNKNSISMSHINKMLIIISLISLIF